MCECISLVTLTDAKFDQTLLDLIIIQSIILNNVNHDSSRKRLDQNIWFGHKQTKFICRKKSRL